MRPPWPFQAHLNIQVPRSASAFSIKNFIEAETWPLRRSAIYSATYIRGGLAAERLFDFAKGYMAYDIRHSVDYSGNPAFCVVNAGFKFTAELL